MEIQLLSFRGLNIESEIGEFQEDLCAENNNFSALRPGSCSRKLLHMIIGLLFGLIYSAKNIYPRE